MDEKLKKNLLFTGGKIALAGTAAAASAATGSAAPAAVALGVLGNVVGDAMEIGRRIFLSRVETWWTAVAGGSLTEEQIANDIRSRLDEKETAEVIIASIRNLYEVVDESAIPALGILAREYLRVKKPADRFFRGFSRLLRELEADELAALQTTLRQAAELRTFDSTKFVVVEITPEGQVVVSAWTAPSDSDRRASSPRIRFQPLLHALKSHGLATEQFHQVDSLSCAIDQKTAEAMHRILDSADRTSSP